MKLQKSSGQLKKLKELLIIRRVSGDSMAPTLLHGKIVLASGMVQAKMGNVVVIRHEGKDKIKRLKEVRGNEIYVLGDNLGASSDSRHFGWIPRENIVGVVIMPRWSRRG